jgi:hypothetical protein
MVWDKLDAFARALLPAIVVSCKCDASQRQIDPNSIEQVGIVGGYETMKTSTTSAGSQRKCINTILNMISRKNGAFNSYSFLFLFPYTGFFFQFLPYLLFCKIFLVQMLVAAVGHVLEYDEGGCCIATYRYPIPFGREVSPPDQEPILSSFAGRRSMLEKEGRDE